MKQQQQAYIQQAEEKVMSLEVVAPPPVPSEDGDKEKGNNKKRSKKDDKEDDDDEPKLQPGIRVRGNTDNNNNNKKKQKKDAVIIPTTEEMLQLITDPQALQEIQRLQAGALQLTEEKVATADQTYALVDATVKRLDADLEAMEKLLQSTGEFQAAGTAKPNDLAAIQVAAGSPDWILAKVITHDPNTGIYTLSDEDVESSKSKFGVTIHILIYSLRKQVNVQLGILCRSEWHFISLFCSPLFLSHPLSLPILIMYNSVFHLPEAQVVILGEMEKLGKGDAVLAVYPDTTSFYQATVTQPPRKVSGGRNFVMVSFVDDSDEHGITHDKAVPLQHVMLPPYGTMIQQ